MKPSEDAAHETNESATQEAAEDAGQAPSALATSSTPAN